MKALNPVPSAPPVVMRVTGGHRRDDWESARRWQEQQPWSSTPLGPRPPPGGPLFDAAIAGFTAATRLVGAYARGRRNTVAVTVRALDLTFPRLPAAFDGYRLLHVTDPHFDLAPDLAAGIAAAVATCEADLCVFTGDYRADEHGPIHAALDGMAQAVAQIRARDGIVATLGNHDAADMVAPIEAMGVTMLVNQRLTLSRAGHHLTITGLDDVHRFYTPLAAQTLAEPLSPGHFGLILVHSPEMAAEAAAAGHALYLCGHTHGGQICLPGGRPLFSHLHRNRPLAQGLWRLGAMTGYTSPGAGASSVPLRYFSRSEVTLVTLRRG